MGNVTLSEAKGLGWVWPLVPSQGYGDWRRLGVYHQEGHVKEIEHLAEKIVAQGPSPAGE